MMCACRVPGGGLWSMTTPALRPARSCAAAASPGEVEGQLMSKLVPVSRQTHAGQIWRRLSTYSFAAKEPYVPIGGAEFGRVVSTMPIAFVETAGQFVPVAVLSLSPKDNLFVGPDGRWLGGYIPLMFRFYPFRLLRQPGTDQFSLWVDEEAQDLPDAAASTEVYYDAEGQLAPGTKALFDSLAQFEQNRMATMAAVAALQAEKVICRWELKIKEGDQDRDVSGLHRVDEVALNALDDAAFLRLRKAGVMPIAYAQLLSMGHVANFGYLQQLRARMGPGAARPPAQPGAAPAPGGSFTMVDPDSLRFE